MADTGAPASGGPRGIVLQLGPLKLAGISAVVGLLVIVALIVALVIVLNPRFAMSPLWISAGLWLAFMVYWGAAAKGAAATQTSESRSSRQFHETLLNVGLVLLFLRLPGLGRRWLPVSPWVIPGGLSLQVASGLFAVWARRHLGRNWSGAITAKVDHQLVRTGPYRLVRHPIYTAMLGMFLGTAMVAGELHALLAVAIVAFAYARKIPLEERNLHNVFGQAYDDYRRHSRALIPWLL